MTLDTLNFEWTNFLRSGRCPPILGLVPLSESEYTQTGALIAAKLRDRNLPAYQALIELLSRYPAIVGIWIARKAGEAYDAGGFGRNSKRRPVSRSPRTVARTSLRGSAKAVAGAWRITRNRRISGQENTSRHFCIRREYPRITLGCMRRCCEASNDSRGCPIRNQMKLEKNSGL